MIRLYSEFKYDFPDGFVLQKGEAEYDTKAFSDYAKKYIGGLIDRGVVREVAPPPGKVGKPEGKKGEKPEKPEESKGAPPPDGGKTEGK